MVDLGDADLARELSSRGFKLTRQRRAVLQVIADCEGRLDPAELYAEAKRVCPRIGLTTVYRTLEILSELGAVKRVHLEHGCHSYAPASNGHRHYLVCSGCQQVVEFDGCDLAGALGAVAARTGFRIEGHWLQLFGQCPACQERQAAQADAEMAT